MLSTDHERSEQKKMSEWYQLHVSKNSSVKELQRLLDNAGVPWSDCVEKHDLVNLALEEEAKVLSYLTFEARNTSEVARNTSEALQRNQSAGEIEKNPEQLEQDMRRRVTDEARNRGMSISMSEWMHLEKTGYTCLHIATLCLANNAVEYFLNHADRVTSVDTKTNLGGTALHLSCSHGLDAPHPNIPQILQFKQR
jgi:hypothetical protein